MNNVGWTPLHITAISDAAQTAVALLEEGIWSRS